MAIGFFGSGFHGVRASLDEESTGHGLVGRGILLPTALDGQIRRVGNSLGVVLPKEALSRLNVAEGDPLYLTEAPDGVRLTAADPEFARQMAVAEKGMKRYRNALRELAK